MKEAHLQLIEKITALGDRWHDAGTVGRDVLLKKAMSAGGYAVSVRIA
jgi:hypothetical protein